MRIVAWFVGLWLVVAARPAEACGFWSMTDKEKKREIGFLINSASVRRGSAKVGAIYLDVESAHAKRDGMRTVKDRRVQFDIKNGKLRKFGKPVATIDGTTITFGKKTYTIELTNPHEVRDGMKAWDLVVKRGDTIILESKEASALCVRPDMHVSDAQKEDEVRRRVMFYLAWREVGG